MNSRSKWIQTNDWGCDVGKRGRALQAPSRRAFLRNGALALVGTSAIPAFLMRSVEAQVRAYSTQGRRLVVIFQRGACDGLNVVVPYTEKNYYTLRPNIAIQPGEVLDLDGRFGLHPAMAALRPLYSAGHLAVVHAVGSPDPTRSHFDAQDYMESGTPGVKATPDGWLNRALAHEPGSKQISPFRAVALGPQIPRTLAGTTPAVALSNLADFSVVTSQAAQEQPVSHAFQAMYDQSSDTLLRGTGRDTFEAVRMLRASNPAQYTPANGVNYPATPFGGSMRQIAQLLKADLGVQAAFADVGGWDTHQNQGGATGQLASRLREFSDSLAAFWLDLGDAAEQVTVVTMSEFGRTAQQNGTGGTDHGHANVMFVLGGGVRGGRVYGAWPGMAPEQLHDGRDLAVTTDFRSVLSEAVSSSLDVKDPRIIFPNSPFTATNPLGFTQSVG